MQELWGAIDGYKDKYEVSSKGRVRKTKNNKITYLKLTTLRDGYLKVHLNTEEKMVGRLVHRLVAKVFIDNPDNKPIINHKDFDKTNNSVENLEWVTHKENTQHALKHGKFKRVKGMNWGAKLNKHQLKFIKDCLNKGIPQLDIAKAFFVTQSTISNVNTGRYYGA